MNLKELKEIIAMFEEADISELDVERQGMKIRLKAVRLSSMTQASMVVVLLLRKMDSPLSE